MQIEFSPDEEWLELPQDARYLVSTHGRLYDLKSRRIVPLSTAASLKLPAWSIRDNRPGAGSPNRYIPAARTVLSTFAPISGGHEPGYLDGNPSNFRLDNLAWIPKGAREPSRV